MSGAQALSARLALMLTELRVPTIKRVAGDQGRQSDQEGWPGVGKSHLVSGLCHALIEARCKSNTRRGEALARELGLDRGL